MADPNVSNVTFEYCARFIDDLYNLATNLTSKQSITQHEKTMFLARYQDMDRQWQRMEAAFAVIMAHLSDKDQQRAKVEAKLNKCSDMVYSIKSLESFFVNVESKLKHNNPGRDFHLPKITLARFSGVHVEWPNFINIFNSLIHNNENLDSVEKMHYLLSVLDKEPLSLVKHLPISNENYMIAHRLLTDRYENKRIIADKHVEAILNMPSIKEVNAKNISKLLNTIKENTQALQALKFDVQSWSFLLLHIVLRKLPPQLRTKFESSTDTLCIPSFNEVLNFLEKQHRILENVYGSTSKPVACSNTLNIVGNNKSEQKANSTMACPCCAQIHAIYRCSKFNSMSPLQRKSFVIQQKLCFNCLRTHNVSKCTSSSVCQVCRGRHHTKLHISTQSTENQHSDPAPVPKPSESAVSTHSSAVQTLHGNNVASTMILGTAYVSVQDVAGHLHSARALIDSGSQVSIMTEDLAQRLRLPRSKSGNLYGLGASYVQETRGIVHCTVKSTLDNKQSFSSDFIILKKITGHMPTIPVDTKVLDFCKSLTLADANFTVPGQIDLLLGIEYFEQILDGKRLSLGENMPTAHSSIFGWIIMGKAPIAAQYATTATSLACMDLGRALDRFWEVEEPPKPPIQDPEDILCEKHFMETHRRDNDGRFVVSLPFKVNHKPLGETHLTALKRFHNLERKLIREPRLRELYIAFMRDYLEAGHMREVPDPTPSERYYIPHHGVLKEQSSSTKLRAVFDASAPSSSGVSLNQALMSGPKLQQNIEDILLRFRLHGVVFTCDVKQMYRQVRMRDADCKYQTILWRESPDTPVKHFELATVTYGVSSSAFQAIRVLHELAHLNATKHPEASKMLLENTFVDDVVGGARDVGSAKILAQAIVDILAEGGFLLRKWSSNSQEFLEGFPVDHRESPYRFEEDGENIFKVLGIEWNASHDSFVYHVSELSKVFTKRGVLSNIARLYDPCGFLSPVTFFAKLFMQRLWSIDSGWDDPLPADIHKTWIDFMSDFHNLNKITIPRCATTDQLVSSQLHGFSDASERGYAACVYLRVQDVCGRVLVRLLLAKSRVAPLKQKLTVPKLELNGALLLARLLEHVLNILKGKLLLEGTMAWSDSTIVLSWLKTSPHKLQTYEGNRVSQIQSMLPNVAWRHVISAMNPCDSASRGLLPTELVSHTLWWSPAWLEGDPSSWPGDYQPVSDADLPGLKASNANSCAHSARLSELPPVTGEAPREVQATVDLLAQSSSFPKLQATVAWCKRFMHNARNPTQKRTGLLSVAELNESLCTIVKLVQSTEFAETLKLLRANRTVKGNLMRLNPFLDADGLIRVGGRLSKSDLEYSCKHPLLLPKSHHVTHLIVDYYHRLFQHPGLTTLWNLLQRKFWILSARRVIRSRIFQCQRCYRSRPKSIQPFMADLPSSRVTPCRPFERVGVDFAGPFMLKTSRLRNAKGVKAYLCIFVCFTTKCCHLELVSELPTDAFLACFDRFVSRRGLPRDVYSDCGTNFVGTSNYLKEITKFLKETQPAIQKSLAGRQISWHFNPPASPHMGGLWETAVRSAKLILTRIIGDRPLVFEELATIFSKVEAALNSRPLCSISNDPNDLESLTPGHFLIGQPLLALPEQSLCHENIGPLKRWHLVRQITQHFWRRWQTEYLHTLQQRPKWAQKAQNLKLGDLVLIKEPNLPPLQWRKARVIRICPGTDGTVRVVELKTSNGTLLRPTVKLCPLMPCTDQ